MFWKFMALLYAYANFVRQLTFEEQRSAAEARRLEREADRIERETEAELQRRERERTGPPVRHDLPYPLDWRELIAFVQQAAAEREPSPLALVFPTPVGFSASPDNCVAFVITSIDAVRYALSPDDPLRLRIYRHGSGKASFRYVPIWESQAEGLRCRILELPADPQA